jgi:GxxExxY protein
VNPTPGDGFSVQEKSNRPPQRNGTEPESPERAALEGLVEAVVGAAYEVSNVLGAGFLEKLYERALIEELRLRGIPTASQATFPVAYKGKHIGTYAADLVVDGCLLVEIKCVEQLTNEHLAECINYLKASGLHLALLINFRKPRVEWRRVVHNL